jgi:hypothetical protein
MTIEFDEKGKYFTDIIQKVAVPAIIQTVLHRIEGAIHVRPDQRIKDELDREELFLAVTDAKVYDMNGSLLHEANFLSVRRAQIVWVIPRDEQDEAGGE